MNLQKIMLSEKTTPKRSLLYYSIYIPFLEWQIYRNRQQIRGCQELKMGRRRQGSGCGYKGNLRSPCVDRNALYFDCVNVNILVVI